MVLFIDWAWQYWQYENQSLKCVLHCVRLRQEVFPTPVIMSVNSMSQTK